METLGQSTGVTLFLGNLQETVKYAINYFGGNDYFKDGDVIIMNDAYVSGTHLNDVTVFMPIFCDGILAGYAANRAHWLDVGSKDPMAPMDSTNIFQEGLRMGPMKIIDAGVPREDLIDTICLNTRFPKNIHGDLNAQVAACKTGAKRLNALIKRFGMETIRSATYDIFEQTAKMEEEITRQIPAGVYEEVGYLDNDGASDDPGKVQVKVTVDDQGHLEIDLTGSNQQVAGSTNCGFSQAIGGCRVAYKMLVLPQAPVTGGSFRNLDIVVPKHSIFSAEEPAACSWYFTAIGLMVDLIIKALSRAVPHMVNGAHYGDSMVCYLYGNDPATGELYANDEPTVGGWGGYDGGDGQDCLINVANGDFKNFPVEVFERKFPVLVDEYTLRTDSEGAGKYRGGLGAKRTYRMLTDTTSLSARFARSKDPAWGVCGGLSAQGPKINVLNEKGEVAEDFLKVSQYKLGKGWVVQLRTGGGGGYGDPAERNIEKVEYDVKGGYITQKKAQEVYKVIFDKSGEVDMKKTAQARSK